MVTMGVTGRSVGDGSRVGVSVGVSVGEGVKVDVGEVVGVGVLVNVGVGPWTNSKNASARVSPCTANTVCTPTVAYGGSVGVSNGITNVPSAVVTAWPNSTPVPSNASQ